MKLTREDYLSYIFFRKLLALTNHNPINEPLYSHYVTKLDHHDIPPCSFPSHDVSIIFSLHYIPKDIPTIFAQFQ